MRMKCQKSTYASAYTSFWPHMEKQAACRSAFANLPTPTLHCKTHMISLRNISYSSLCSRFHDVKKNDAQLNIVILLQEVSVSVSACTTVNHLQPLTPARCKYLSHTCQIRQPACDTRKVWSEFKLMIPSPANWINHVPIYYMFISAVCNWYVHTFVYIPHSQETAHR